MKDENVAQIFSPLVVDKLVAASRVGEPDSIQRRLAVEAAVKYAKNRHPQLFKVNRGEM